MSAEKLQSDGFVIDNGIIKGKEKYYHTKERNVGELILNILSETPEHVRQIDALTGQNKTYAQIREQSVLLASWMRSEGIGPGDVISLCSARHPLVDVIFNATIFVGATYFPFSYYTDLISSRRLINVLPPRLMFAHNSKIDVLAEAAVLENHTWKIIAFDDDCNHKSLNDIFAKPSFDEIKHFKVSEVNPEDLCLVIPTSGTTGNPKFIPIDYRNFMQTVFAFDIVEKIDNSNRIVLTYSSPEWKVNYVFSIKCLLNRWTLIFHNEFDCRDTFKIIEKYKINILFFDVYEILRLNQADPMRKYDLQSVTNIHSIGSKLFDEVRKKMLDIFPNVQYIGRGLGMTEVGLLTLFAKNCRNPQSEGTVVPNVQLKIIDTETSLTLGCNKVGELYIKSPCLMTGYYKDPTATKLAFDDEGWFHSGDEAYYDEHGEIVVVGRLKEMIRYRGYDVYPSYIEQNLFLHPRIIDAAVVGIDHEFNTEQPVAFVKVTKGSTMTEDDVLNLIPKLEYNDIFKNWIIFTDDIPRSANGKIIRRILRERAEQFYSSRS